MMICLLDLFLLWQIFFFASVFLFFQIHLIIIRFILLVEEFLRVFSLARTRIDCIHLFIDNICQKRKIAKIVVQSLHYIFQKIKNKILCLKQYTYRLLGHINQSIKQTNILSLNYLWTFPLNNRLKYNKNLFLDFGFCV